MLNKNSFHERSKNEFVYYYSHYGCSLCRQELLAIECHLLQNALERQRHLACIREWQHKRPSISLSTPVGRLTDHEGSCDGHVTKSLAIVTEEVDHCDTQSLAIETEAEESCDTHVTEQIDPCDSCMTQPTNVITEQQERSCDGHVTDHMSITCLSPDSGAEVSSVPTMEPFDVSLAREEVATLVADKQRMEAQHKRLERRLKENRAKGDKIQEVNAYHIWS